MDERKLDDLAKTSLQKMSKEERAALTAEGVHALLTGPQKYANSRERRVPKDQFDDIMRRVQNKGIKGLRHGEDGIIRCWPAGEVEKLLRTAFDARTHGHLLFNNEMLWNVVREREKAKLERSATKQTSQLGQKPTPRLIRSPRDAEVVAEAWMRYWGFSDAAVTAVGSDEGIDVNSRKAVAQVKTYMVPVGRPDVQNLAGVAAVEKKTGIFFALCGYTPQAIEWANKAEIALFSFNLQGEPEALNTVARKVAP